MKGEGRTQTGHTLDSNTPGECDEHRDEWWHVQTGWKNKNILIVGVDLWLADQIWPILLLYLALETNTKSLLELLYF